MEIMNQLKQIKNESSAYQSKMQSKLIENIDSFVYTDGIDEFNDNNQEPIYESGYASRYGSVTSSIKKPLDNYVVNQYPTASSQLGKAIIANGNDLVDHGIPSEMFHTVTMVNKNYTSKNDKI